MHFYGFVRCKTHYCHVKWYVAHQELPTVNGFIHYPEEWFPIEVQCAKCKKKSEYAAHEIQGESSHKSLHPQGWRPLLPHAPASGGIN